MHPQTPNAWRTPRSTGGRLAAAGVVVTLLGLGTAACSSGSPSASAPTTSPPTSAPARPHTLPSGIASTIANASTQDRTAFAQCMRKSGLPDFPSTLTLTALHAAGITVRSSSFLTAARTCWPDLTG
jgi:hypothetical protein